MNTAIDYRALTNIVPSAFALPVTCLSHPDEMSAIEPAWRALENGTSRAVVFQSYDWCSLVWRTRLDVPADDGFEGRVVVVGPLDAPLAIWPLALRRDALGVIASDLTDPFGQYGDLLLARDADLDDVMETALGEIARWRIDGLVLRKVRRDAGIHAWLAANATALGDVEAAPAVELGKFASFDAYHRSLESKTRKNLRNYRNRLSRTGTLSSEVASDRAAEADIVRRCFEGRTGWLEASGQSSTAFAHPAFAALVDALCSSDRGTLSLRAMRLAQDAEDGSGNDLSLHWGLVHNGTYTAYMAAKNPAFNAFSPGRLHLEDLLRGCAADGLAKVDFLAPDMPYKRTFATASMATESFAIPLTLRGKLTIRGWHAHARPALKAAAARLPASWRRNAMRLAGLGPRQA